MKPILFNTKMVKAILAGRKTETRRAMKGQPQGGAEVSEAFARLHNRPRYAVGDILYVRETWGMGECRSYAYKADDISAEFICTDRKWRPSIHMPKEAARLFLRVTNVRAERLQDISDSDIKAEGLAGVCANCYHYNGSCKEFAAAAECKLRAEWKRLWDNTVKPADRDLYGWNANPWVWVYEFERVDKSEVQE